MKSNVYNAENASAKVRNVFNLGENVLFGCIINIERIDAPYKYITENGKQATMSARYHGHIITPNGERIDLNTHAKRRGGWIARQCGLWVSKEKEDMTKHGDLYEVTNRNIIED